MQHAGIATDGRVKEHDPGPGHPEQSARYDAVLSRLESQGLLEHLVAVRAREASDDELALVHTREYIELVRREVAQNRLQLSTGDTAISRQSDNAARIATGAGLAAVDAVFFSTVASVFCLVRPPGHHASAARGMGFCLYNHIAVAARYAQRQYNAERVLIVDWDVHHGNGTQDIFYDDGSVLFFSTHQSPLYPGTGSRAERGEGEGFRKTINCPFPAGASGAEIIGAFRNVLLPAAAEFSPDLVLISAGFDSRRDDPLGQFLLEDEDFSTLTQMMMDLAAQYCDGRLISLLEGGYNLEGLAKAAEAHVRTLIQS